MNTTNQNRARLRIADCRLRTRQSALGFTLIELLLVLVILGILAAIVVPKFSGRTEQARMTAAQSQISTFNTALETLCDLVEPEPHPLVKRAKDVSAAAVLIAAAGAVCVALLLFGPRVANLLR